MEKTFDLLLEIGVEEIPARLMPDILKQLAAKGEEKFTEARLVYSRLEIFGSPRRLILYVQGLAEKAKDLEIEIKGPPKNVAFDKQGKPTKAALGFARNQGIEVGDLKLKHTEGGEYIFAFRSEPGCYVKELAPQILKDLITSLSFPKSMRWGAYQLRFIRPIRWLVALLGEEVIPFAIAGVESGRVTHGHRFLGEENISLKDASSYFKTMEQHYVLLDPKRREMLIREQAEEIGQREYAKVLWDETLLAEVVNLLEYPTAFMGSFDDAYLDLPAEVIVTAMKEHQRYFPMVDYTGELLPKFIAVRNGTKNNIDIVREGNEKVLRARLADAKFFYEEDKKIPLWQKTVELKNVVFLEGLGTVYDKVERLQELAGHIIHSLGIDEPVHSLVQRTVNLSKADLVTKMVNEFSELQGIMGREYALLDRENPLVAQGIYEHYLPRFSGDELPQTMLGSLVSIVDKLDNICGCFGIGIIPTGSNDPYALRRQAYGIVNILLSSDLDLGLSDLIDFTLKTYQNRGLFSKDVHRVKGQVMDFFVPRIKNALGERGFSYDSIEAVMAVDFDNIREALARLHAINKVRQGADFADFLTIFTRIHNLARQAPVEGICKEDLLVEAAEKELYKQFRIIKPKYGAALQEQDYTGAIQLLLELQLPLNVFFDEVLVMAKEENLKRNRLALLKELDHLFTQIADFSQIVI
jgi:glycyl-tRNA synthetase beta chain